MSNLAVKKKALKFHESRLLKKVDFINYGSKQVHFNGLITKYKLKDSQELISYQAISKSIHDLAKELSLLDPRDTFRVKKTEALLNKLYDMGVIDEKSSLQGAIRIVEVNLLRRRLSAMLVRMKMATNITEAHQLITRGNIRVGPQILTDPAFLVTRNMEDFITWSDTSKIRAVISKVDNRVDDYDILNT